MNIVRRKRSLATGRSEINVLIGKDQTIADITIRPPPMVYFTVGGTLGLALMSEAVDVARSDEVDLLPSLRTDRPCVATANLGLHKKSE